MKQAPGLKQLHSTTFFLPCCKKTVCNFWIAEPHWYHRPSRTELILTMWKLQKYCQGNLRTFPPFRECLKSVWEFKAGWEWDYFDKSPQVFASFPAVQSICFKSRNTFDTNRETTDLCWSGFLHSLDSGLQIWKGKKAEEVSVTGFGSFTHNLVVCTLKKINHISATKSRNTGYWIFSCWDLSKAVTFPQNQTQTVFDHTHQ